MGRWRKVKQGKVENPVSKKSEKSGAKKEETACAPVFLRLKAFLTDTFMIVMPILYIVIYLVMGSREGFREHIGEGWLIILAAHSIAVIAFWAIAGQTPGMRAYDLLLVDPQTNQKPGIVKLVLRYVMMQTAIFSILGLFLPFFLKSREALHDLVSGTCILWQPRIHEKRRKRKSSS
ncbi:RDD family protein [Hydrogenimonas urashimensis]|uniref:RDD family protein n=1 Tax=Hydrogenimonas urashimensis TaxID=2740515 RepID=UPI001916561A|nr:RDD family protein [Hydrogenimonas urashimensis]